MRKLFLGIFLGLSLSTQACDICGCSGGMSVSGLFPQVQNNLVGIRSSWQRFNHPKGNFNGPSEVFSDDIIEADLFLRWFPAKRLQVWINAPYRLNQRIESERITTVRGIGDMQVRAFYTLLKPDTNYKRYRHFVLAGGGFSLPTGKYRQRDENFTLLPIGMQTGTGAWSSIASLLYLVQTHRVGLQVQGDLRLNGENEDTFKKGNNVGVQTGIFLRRQLFRNVLFLPQASYRYDQSQRDQEFGLIRPVSGSSTHSAQLGFDCFGSGWMMGVFVRKPMVQHQAVSMPKAGLIVQLTAGITW